MIRKSLFRLVLLGILFHAPGGRADHSVVLVVDANCPIEDVTSLELRKIYFGITVRRGGKAVKGLRNATDEQLKRVFLQQVVAMSDRSYERRLLSLTLKYGRRRPPEFTSRQELLEALSNDPYTITYMWYEDVVSLKNVKILKILWEH